MTLEQELELSYYQQVADIDSEHYVSLVQDTRTKKFYVKKLLTVYNADIYRYLKAHPIANTPHIYLVVENNNILTVIEEYIPGDTLEDLLHKQGTLPQQQAQDIIYQLSVIVSAFHHCRPAIVNRDIKPSNIKVTEEGAVKLLDMNAAKWSNLSSAKDTVLLGTQGYAAPEQYGFGPSSILSDIYSLGVLLNVMLCGEFPNKQIAGGQLGKVVRKCVELSPSARYQSIEALQDAIQSLPGADGSSATGKARWKRFLPPGFRHKRPIVWLFSVLGYALLFAIGLDLQVENAGAAEVLINRITFTLTGLCIVLFNGNYLNVQRYFPLTRSPKRWIRWLGMAIIDFVLMVLWVLVTNLLVRLFVQPFA